MRSLAARALACVVCATLVGACAASAPDEPLKLERNMLTVDNRTSNGWTNVEVLLNGYYGGTVPSIPAGGRLQIPLDSFTTGFGQRFNFNRMQVKSVELRASQSSGTPLRATYSAMNQRWANIFRSTGPHLKSWEY